MSKKYGLTKKERNLLGKARYYQDKALQFHKKFADSLQNRFYNSTTINEFEEWDLYTLCESGDCTDFYEDDFWEKVKKEEKNDR